MRSTKNVKLLVILVFCLSAMTILTSCQAPFEGPTRNLNYVKPQRPAPHLDHHYKKAEQSLSSKYPIKESLQKDIIYPSRIFKGKHGVHRKLPVSICSLHGFTASPYELYPILHELSEELGIPIFLQRLTGHAHKDYNEMAKATYQDWITDAIECSKTAEAMASLVIYIGMSTGATLVADLVKQGEILKPKKVILLSPNFGLPQKHAMLLTLPLIGPLIGKIIEGPTRTWVPKSVLHEKWWYTTYPTSAIVHLMKLLSRVKLKDFKKWDFPTTFIVSPHDDVIDLKKAKKAFDLIPSNNKQYISEPEFKSHNLAGKAIDPEKTQLLKNLIGDAILK